jgi:arabinogalactan endo-1,4-beta-galactosidase
LLSGRLINNGYNAGKAVYPDAKVIVHLANGYDNAVFRWFFDGVKAAGAKWDVIGMSHYPPARTGPATTQESPPICGTWWRATPSRSW